MAYASQLCSTCENKNEECYCAPNSVCKDYKEENFLAKLFNELNIKSKFDKICIVVMVYDCYKINKALTLENTDEIINKLIDKVCSQHEFSVMIMASVHREEMNRLMSAHLNIDVQEYIKNYIKEHEIMSEIKIGDN